MTHKPTVRVAFLDVGQGDTIIVSIPDTQEAVIIDCVDADAVLSYLKQNCIQHIRGVIVTHLHFDHCKGILDLLDNLESELGLICERLLCDRPKMTKQLWEKIQDDEDGHSSDLSDEKSKKRQSINFLRDLRRWTQSHPNRYNTLAKQPGIKPPLPEVIELIHPREVDIDDLIGRSLNDISGVLKIHGRGSNALLTGDLEPTGWEYLKKNVADLSCDALKFPHHGAWKDGNPDDLLETVEPSIVVISVGTNGSRYDHPNSHVFDALAQRPHIRLLCTQVTDKCITTALEKRQTIIKQFQERVAKSGEFFVEQSGCPCAGTVIIELGESADILQPSLQFHHEHIIKPNFSNHRCAID